MEARVDTSFFSRTSLLRLALLSIGILVLSACASTSPSAPAFRQLPASARNQIHSMEVLVGLDQQEIAVGNRDYVWLPLERSKEYGLAPLSSTPSVNIAARGGQGDGLIILALALSVAVIGATTGLVVGTGEAGLEGYRNFMGSRAAAPINRSLSSLDVAEQMRAALFRPDGPQLLLRDGQVTLVSPATPENFEAFHAMSGDDSVMIINVRYAASTDLNTLSLKAEASLLPKSDALWKLQYESFRKGQRMDKLPGALQTDPRHALYRRVMEYRMSLPKHEDDRDRAARIWAENDGSMLRAAFSDGLQVIAQFVVSDLAGTPIGGALDLTGKHYLVTYDHQDVTLVRKQY
jgi:hypothetical protein